MRGRCKHPSEHVVTKFEWADPYDGDVEWSECLDCGIALPLGPSRDDGEFAEAVAVEVRAAELAALSDEIGDDPDDFMYVGEFNGWEIHRLDKVGAIDTGRAPGYLARCITTHTEQREASDE